MGSCQAPDLEALVRARTEELEAANAKIKARCEQLEQTNRDFERALEELRRAFEGKREFVSAVSHELRTPLNSVIGFSSILVSGGAGELTPEQLREVEMIRKAGEHMLALINDMLDLSRVEAGRATVERSWVDVQLLVEEVTGAVKVIADEKDLELRVGGVDVAEIHTDPKLVRQILLNLLANSVKFTAAGMVRLDVFMRAGAVIYAVSDTGPGVAEADADKVFESFSQLDGPRGEGQSGTGLGLAISRRLARLLGGDVSLATPASHDATRIGCTFEFWEPLVEP